MRLTLVREDNVCSIDGRNLTIDLSDLPANFRALQWYDTKGEVEFVDEPNQKVTSLKDYQKWVDRGLAEAKRIDSLPPPPPPPPPPRVPSQVTRYQALVALELCGYRKTVDDYIRGGTADPLTVIAWDNASVFERSNQMVIEVSLLLGLTPSQIDDLFIYAATIP